MNQPLGTDAWVTIPGGTFVMGSPRNELDRDDNEDQFEVTLRSYRVARYPVTFDEYDAFCTASGRPLPGDNGWGRGRRPVMNISWHDACAYAGWMRCRLPTEAEWEYACRAGTTTVFNTGDDLSTDQANYDGNSPYRPDSPRGILRAQTVPVGSFAPNTWGIYDMHGNVWQWCSDWDAPYSTGPQKDPVGPVSGQCRIFRGGSWPNQAKLTRSANRAAHVPEFFCDHLGMRLARDI